METSDLLKSDPALAPIRDALDQSFSQQALKEIDPLFNGIQKVDKHVDRVTIVRDKPATIPLSGQFLNGNIKVESLSVGNVAFDFDRKTQSASNIDGVAVNLNIFGSSHAVEVEKVRIGRDSNGNKVVFADVDNPLPEPAQRIIGMPPTISVELPIMNGDLSSARLSQVFSDAAGTTGPSIAGLLAQDALKEASNVALFVETNPKWVDYVLDPVLHDIYKQLNPAPKPHSSMSQPSPTPGATAHRIQNPGSQIGQIGQPGTLQPRHAEVGDHDEEVVIQGAKRHYKVHVPPSYNGQTPMPLVLLLHGLGQDGEEIARYTKLNEMADRKGFIAVYPDARSWAGRKDWRSWDSDNGLLPPGENADDVAFLRHIIDTSERDYKIDSNRIYMGGLSNGGMMSFRAAGELSDKLAAVATVSGAMSGTEPPPRSPLSILNIHGTEDRIVPYEGLKNVPSSLTAIGLPKFKPMDYTTNYWVEQNKITTPPLILEGKDVTQRRFIDSASGIEVNEYTIHGGRHVPDNIPQVTETIWNFFEAHPKASGQVSGTVQPDQEHPFNITERVQAHLKARGIRGLEIDTGKMLNELQWLSDGKFSPSQMMDSFEKQAGVKLNDSTSQFLKSTLEVSKSKQTIAIDLDTAKTIQIQNAGSGSIKLNSIKIDDTSFDVKTVNGMPSFQNIHGISFNMTALGRDMSTGLTELTQKMDNNNVPYYRLKAENPLPSLLRTVMLADSQVPVELRLDNQGASSVLNEREIKDSALGVNPITRGYIDVGSHVSNFYSEPSWNSALHIGKDVSIVGASGYGAWRLAALKFGTKGRIGAAVTVGLVVAPAIIHGVERLID